jgi:uncharacterized FlaG/YvyC family protein
MPSDTDKRLAEIVARKQAADQKKAAEEELARQKAERDKQIAKQVAEQLPHKQALVQTVIRQLNEVLASVHVVIEFQISDARAGQIACYTIGVDLDGKHTGFVIQMNVDAQGTITGYQQATLMHQPLPPLNLLDLDEEVLKALLVDFLDKCVK